jgi:hypothetical protein
VRIAFVYGQKRRWAIGEHRPRGNFDAALGRHYNEGIGLSQTFVDSHAKENHHR